VSDLNDYLRSEAERLPNGTAARFFAALDAMESDSDMNVKSLDCDKDVTSGLHARSKRLERSTPDALGQRDATHAGLWQDCAICNPTKHAPDQHFTATVTVTISRNCAEYFAERACTNDRACFTEVGGCVAFDCHLEQACRAALEAER
jgi:hypothetical protein